MPTALATPCPSGPVVVSTPGVRPCSGWPGVFEPSCRKRLISSSAQVEARQVQQRVEQHRAVAGREHEAIAIEPGRVLPGSTVRNRRAQRTAADIGHAHRHARVPGVGLLDRVLDRGLIDGDRRLRVGSNGCRYVATPACAGMGLGPGGNATGRSPSRRGACSARPGPSARGGCRSRRSRPGATRRCGRPSGSSAGGAR